MNINGTAFPRERLNGKSKGTSHHDSVSILVYNGWYLMISEFQSIGSSDVPGVEDEIPRTPGCQDTDCLNE
jgi:hypothetical protein